MPVARERPNVLAAAIAYFEQRVGENDPVLALGEYVKGEHPISHLRWVMERQLGIAVEGAKVIPLVPRNRGA